MQIFCCDTNGQVGNLEDCIHEVDNMSPRVCLDDKTNKHGESFIDFLLESRMCIANGRITPHLDNFTSVSTRGRSVIDFFAVNQEFLPNCVKCEVQLTSELLQACNFEGLIGDKCRPPDHSLVSLVIDTGTNCNVNVESSPATHKRYKYNDIPSTFMSSAYWRQVVDNIIAKIETVSQSKLAIDNLYSNICKEIFSEIDSHLMIHDSHRPSRKKFKNYKPYWNNTLSELWKDMVTAEKLFLKCPKSHKFSRERQERRTFLKNKQHIFDKELRRSEREYNKKFAEEIDELNTKKSKTILAIH